MNLFTVLSKDHGISCICILFKYVCILVYEELALYTLEFIVNFEDSN